MLARRLAILATLVLGTASIAQANGYGFDLPPGTSLQSSTSHFYGSDRVPRGWHHSAGVHAPYGVDRVPGDVPTPPHRDPHRQKMLEVIQHLTGSVEETPEEPTPSRAWQFRSWPCGNGN